MSQARLWNRMAKVYARRAISDTEGYQRKLDRMATRLDPTSRVLDAGCGTGTMALWLAPRVGHVRGLDFSTSMIDIARSRAAETGIANVRFDVAAIDDLPPPEEPFDAALAMSVLHLLPDPGAVLASLAAHLRPGGMLFTSTVCLRDMGGILPRLVPLLGRTGLIPRLRPLSMTEVIALHEEAGFRLLDHWHSGPGAALFIEAQRPA